MGDNGFIYGQLRIMDTRAKTFSGFLGKEMPRGMICTIEFNRIV